MPPPDWSPRSGRPTLPGASWQRDRTHYAANLMSVTPKASWPWVKALLRSVYDQPDTQAVRAQFDRVLDTLAPKLPRTAEHLEAAREELLAFTAFPEGCWHQIWSGNLQERLNREIRRRSQRLTPTPKDQPAHPLRKKDLTPGACPSSPPHVQGATTMATSLRVS